MNKNFPYKSILVLCSVGTARSPMACYFLKDFFSKANLDVRVEYGGIASNARDGMMISMDAKLVMEEIGVKLSDSSISLDVKKYPEMIKKADLILTMTEAHKREVLKLLNNEKKDIFTIKEFAGSKGDIEDPSMKEIEGFRKARDDIIKYLKLGLKRFNLY